MSETQSGKEKSSRVRLDYFRGEGTRKRIAWLVFVLVAGAASVFAITGSWKQAASPGPMHSVHAAWENQCSACHDGSLHPTGSRNGLHRTTKWLPGVGGVRKSDKLCKGCHEAPAHHKAEIEGEIASCAACHQEHRGRDSALLHVSDGACVRCHADLRAHHADAKTAFGNVTTFSDAGHPPFRQIKDPGKLRFNHALHLRAGLTREPGDARKWTLQDIAPEARERYRNTQTEREDTAPVRLTCASCHQRDERDQLVPGEPARREPGDQMLPVTFDQHCKACHPLKFDATLPPAPHHLQPADLNQYLWGALATKAVKDPALAKNRTDRPLPGVNVTREEADARKRIADEAGALAAFLHQDIKKATERFVYQSRNACSLCHTYDDPLAPTKVAPTRLPRVWFEHAAFSHRAHRAVDCQQCHERAGSSTTESDVLLPGIATCVTCHAPARVENGKPHGGVRHDCITCHRYHHGDEPLAGRGAEARGLKPSSLRTLEEFLGGAHKDK